MLVITRPSFRLASVVRASVCPALFTTGTFTTGTQNFPATWSPLQLLTMHQLKPNQTGHWQLLLLLSAGETCFSLSLPSKSQLRRQLKIYGSHLSLSLSLSLSWVSARPVYSLSPSLFLSLSACSSQLFRTGLKGHQPISPQCRDLSTFFS
jgi:hypothetical protein